MKKNILKYYSLLIVLFFSYSHRLYADELKEHLKVWTSTQITGSITDNKKWRYYFQPELKFLDDKYKFNQADVYLGVYYQAVPAVSYWLGGFKRYTIRSDGRSQQENRLWEQVSWTVFNNESVEFVSRNRLEERKNLMYSQIAYRFRERLSLKFPIKDHDNYFIVLADEVFFQLNLPKWVPNQFVSQNQASISVVIPLNAHTSYQLGYMNQFQFTTPKQMSNILVVSLVVALD